MKQYYTLTQITAALLLITAICVSYLQESENMEQNPVHMIDPEAEFE